MAFKTAVKRKLKARVAIDGPTGSGKTYTGLKLLRALCGKKGKIAVIDTEHKTASKYLGDAIDTFDVEEFETFEPQRYIDAINAAEEAGYDGLLIDSYSHAWAGKGGALEMVDNVAAKQAATSRSGKQDNFSAWREVTPLHNELVERMIRFNGHLIVTMRSKMAYEKVDGKIVKLGMQPIQRDGVEYEFDVVCDMDVKHNLAVSKTRCAPLDGKMFKKPTGEDIAKPLLKWLNEGADEPKPETVAIKNNDVVDQGSPVQTPAEKTAAAGEVARQVLGGKTVTFKLTGNASVDEAAEATALIEAAQTIEELREVAGHIKVMQNLNPAQKKALLDMWRTREKALKEKA